VLAEVARRDPRWLGDLCVGTMASPILVARCEAAAVFRELTGRLFDFDPVAFEAKRAPALGRLAMWWSDHRNETRDEWILSYFREQGIEIDSLDARESIPALVEALGRDRVLHDRAVEALTRITGHPFDRHERMEQERAWIVEWLEARGWLESSDGDTSPRDRD
jgi:hypothetical protein